MKISVNFVQKENVPERLVCEAEIVFGDECGPLAGMKLVGFSLWRSPDGEVYVTFPSRAFGAGSERRYFDYLRSVDGLSTTKAGGVKAWIKEEWIRQQGNCQHHTEGHLPGVVPNTRNEN